MPEFAKNANLKTNFYKKLLIFAIKVWLDNIKSVFLQQI